MAVEIISTVLIAATATAPAGPYDLTDLATVHDELDIATDEVEDDPFLQRGITQSSTSINTYCNRVFAIEAISDFIYIQQDPYPYQVPGGVYPLQLTRWPLVNTAVINFTGNLHGTDIIDGIVSTKGLTAGLLVFEVPGSIPPVNIPSGTVITAVGANSITLSNATLTSTGGLTLSTGVQVIQTLSVGDLQTLVYGTDYTLDPKYGWVIRLNSWTGVSEMWEAEPVQVQYQAGYAAVPTDLEDAALKLITMRYRARGRDPRLLEQNQGGPLGTQRYWVGPTPGQSGAFPPEIEMLLTPYRVPVTG